MSEFGSLYSVQYSVLYYSLLRASSITFSMPEPVSSVVPYITPASPPHLVTPFTIRVYFTILVFTATPCTNLHHYTIQAFNTTPYSYLQHHTMHVLTTTPYRPSISHHTRIFNTTLYSYLHHHTSSPPHHPGLQHHTILVSSTPHYSRIFTTTPYTSSSPYHPGLQHTIHFPFNTIPSTNQSSYRVRNPPLMETQH